MTAEGAADRFETCSRAWEEHLRNNDYYAAIGIAVETYAYCRSVQDEERARDCLCLVSVATALLTASENEMATDTSCSFCGRSEKESMPLSALNAFTCGECSDILHEITLCERKNNFGLD